MSASSTDSAVIKYILSDTNTSDRRAFQVTRLIRFGLGLQQSDGAAEAANLLRDFKHHPFKDAVLAFCGGSDELKASELTLLPLLDRYALAPDPEYLAVPDAGLRNTIEACIFRSYGASFPLERSFLDQLLTRRAKRRAPKKILTFQEITSYIEQLHVECWQFFFSDLFVYLIKMLRPLEQLSYAQLKAADFMCYYCGFELIFARLVILRALGGMRVESGYLRKNLDRVFASAKLQGPLEESLKLAFKNRRPDVDRLDIAGDRHPLATMLQLLAYLYSSADVFEFMERLSEVYEHDTSIIFFVDWRRYKHWIEKSRSFLGPHLIFFSTVLTDETVMKRFPFLFTEYWLGGATGDLESYALYFRGKSYATSFNKTERSGFIDFVRSLTSLPEHSRSRTIHSLFKPTTIERLASILTPPISISLQRLGDRKDEYIALSAQMAILNYPPNKTILSREFVEQRKEDVRTFMRNIMYADYKKAGMIRISGLDISRDIQKYFQADFSDYSEISKDLENNKDELISRFERYIANHLCNHICFKSKRAFDYILSNWLRHGWLIRPIENAVLDFVASHPGFVEDTGALLLELEGVVNAFNDDALTIKSQSSFFISLRRETERWFANIRREARDPYLELPTLADICIAALDQMLSAARQRWESEIRSELQRIVSSTISSDKQRNNSIHYHQLLAHLNRCLEETAPWIAVNTRTTDDAADFHFRQLTRFEVENIALGDLSRIGLNFEVYDGLDRRRHKYDVKIPGKYLDCAVRLIDNTTQNAFKRSGYGRRTPLNYVLRCSEELLIVEIQNQFRNADYRKTRADIEKLQSSITRAREMSEDELSRLSRQEGGSGIAKIVFEFRQVFNDNWKLDVVEKGLDPRWFAIRAHLPIVGATLVAPKA